MKTHLLLLTALLCAPLAPAEAAPTDGEVVAVTGTECSDYFAVKIGDGYAILEWFSGPMPDKGDKVEGEFDSYGFKDITVVTGGGKIRAYVEDYDLSLDDANDKLKAKCN